MKCEKKNCENCHKSSEILSAIVKIKDGRKAEALFVWLNCFEIPADEISTSADRSSFSLVSISSVQCLCGEVGCQTDSALAHSAMHKMCSQYHKVYLLIESLSLDPFFLSDVCSFSRDALNKICKMCMNVCEFVCVCVCVCVLSFHVCLSQLRPGVDLLLPPALLLSLSIPPTSSFPLILALTFFLSKGSTVYIINVISSERSSPSLDPPPLPLSAFPSLPSSHDLPHSLFLFISLNLTHSYGSIFISFSLSLSLCLCCSPPSSRTCNQFSVDERYDWT